MWIEKLPELPPADNYKKAEFKPSKWLCLWQNACVTAHEQAAWDLF